MDIAEIIRGAKSMRASDIHVVRDIPVRVRVDGSLCDYDTHILTEEDCAQVARQLAGERFETLGSCGELDFASTISGMRCRMNVFRQQGAYSSAIRILNERIPALEDLGLPPAALNFVEYRRGIVLVTGETGSGKSTTLAAMLDRINKTRNAHIITLEDPIEYIYHSDRCVINQREIGTDTESYTTGLRSILREDPDVILIGEMRDLHTIEAALTAAETGHLVFATLHTNSAPDTVDRIVDVFPAGQQQQIRLQLSMTLQAVLSQQLLPRKGVQGRALACEVMVLNGAIRSLIREGKSPQIVNALATSAAEGNITMDNALVAMVRASKISVDTAISAAHDGDAVRKQLGYIVPGNIMRKSR